MNKILITIVRLVISFIVTAIVGHFIVLIVNPHLNVLFPPDNCNRRVEGNLVIAEDCFPFVSSIVFFGDLGIYVITFILVSILTGKIISKIGKK